MTRDEFGQGGVETIGGATTDDGTDVAPGY
jgi:hypothetical protein